MESETGYAAIIAAVIVFTIGGFFGALWILMRYARRDAKPYPFNDPNFIHVGLTPRQLEALTPLAGELRFMQWIPQHENRSIDATFYAMTREEFISFFGVVFEHTRRLIALAGAKAVAGKETVLTGDAFTLFHLVHGLTEIRKGIDPSPLAADLALPLASVDIPPAPAR